MILQSQFYRTMRTLRTPLAPQSPRDPQRHFPLRKGKVQAQVTRVDISQICESYNWRSVLTATCTPRSPLVPRSPSKRVADRAGT